MIARPARVRIRSRKPWVFDRRRLFGWNVRLLTRYSYDTTSAVAHPPAGGRARGAGGPARTPPRWPPEAGSRGWTPPRQEEHRRTKSAGARQLTARNPSTDSDQHSRGILRADGCPDSDSPACTRTARCRSSARRGHRVPTRRRRQPDRCRAVDAAVSVAVAPRRASRVPARGSTPSDVAPAVPPPGPGSGPDQRGCSSRCRLRRLRRRASRPVHTLWTLMWNERVQSSTAPVGPVRSGGQDRC
jgi:hypothetical protein